MIKLICPGFAKCGTSDVYVKLNQHPQISLVKPKEINFFNDDEVFEKGYDWYESKLEEAKAAKPAIKVYGEISPAYLGHEKYLRRFISYHRNEPHLKILVMLRDPVEALWSWANFFNAEKIIDEEYLDNPRPGFIRGPVKSYQYSKSLDILQSTYSDVKIVDVNDFEYADIFEWLGLPDITVSDERVNMTKYIKPLTTKIHNDLRTYFEEEYERRTFARKYK